MQKNKKLITLSFLFLTLFPMISGCAPAQKPIQKTGIYFDTVINITIYDESQRSLLDECMQLADSYDHLLSPTIVGSDVYRINHSNGQPVVVSDDTVVLLHKALAYAKLSNGMVDPTVGTLSTLWNFGSDNQEIVPLQTDIDAALKHVDYRVVQVEGNEVTLTDPLAQLDLGFIAKGFIADRMKDFLMAQGVTSAIIELGGNVLTIGTKPDGTTYNVGVQKPFAETGTPALVLQLSDSSTVSSGIYERYFEKEGILYHHILSTATGYPVDNDLASVTIISPQSVDGDALSTLCFVLGLDDGRQFLADKTEISAIFLMKDGTQYPVNMTLPAAP